MADNVAVTAGTGTTVAADEVVDGVLGTVKVQYVKIMDGTIDGTLKAAVTANGMAVVPAASATGTGLTMSRTAAQLAVVTAVKASAGRVYGYHIYNSNVADAYLQFYDVAAGSVTVGTTTPTRTLWIPGGGVIDTAFALPLTFATAISTAATTTIAGSTAPVTGLLTNIDYL